jgi:hypothetical protein
MEDSLDYWRTYSLVQESDSEFVRTSQIPSGVLEALELKGGTNGADVRNKGHRNIGLVACPGVIETGDAVTCTPDQELGPSGTGGVGCKAHRSRDRVAARFVEGKHPGTPIPSVHRGRVQLGDPGPDGGDPTRGGAKGPAAGDGLSTCDLQIQCGGSGGGGECSPAIVVQRDGRRVVGRGSAVDVRQTHRFGGCRPTHRDSGAGARERLDRSDSVRGGRQTPLGIHRQGSVRVRCPGDGCVAQTEDGRGRCPGDCDFARCTGDRCDGR